MTDAMSLAMTDTVSLVMTDTMSCICHQSTEEKAIAIT